MELTQPCVSLEANTAIMTISFSSLLAFPLSVPQVERFYCDMLIFYSLFARILLCFYYTREYWIIHRAPGFLAVLHTHDWSHCHLPPQENLVSDYPISAISKFLENSRMFNLRCHCWPPALLIHTAKFKFTAGFVETGGILTAGVIDTDGILTAGVIDTDGILYNNFVCTGRVPDPTSLFLPTSFCM